jgi:signal transduction histidine kinase
MGLRIMQYRARMIGGTVDVGNGADCGVCVSCAVPAARNRRHGS